MPCRSRARYVIEISDELSKTQLNYMPLSVDDFDYTSPRADQEAAEPRVRALARYCRKQAFHHATIADLPQYLQTVTVSSLTTKVTPARLFGKKPTGGE